MVSQQYCINIEVSYTKACKFFNYQKCFVKNFLSLMHCISFRINTIGGSFSDFIQLWEKKPATVKTTIMPDFDKTIHSKKIFTKSMYGIQNNFLNCWINYVLQIVCGSSLINVTDDTIVNETKSNFH